MKFKTIIFLFFSFSSFVRGQEQLTIDPTTFNYSKADSVALNFPKKKYKSYVELAAPLTETFKTDHEKLRVLFRWITENIKYNYGNKSSDADKVVKSQKAVCIGYSTLLKEMCNSIGIDCEVITGYAKEKVADINKKLNETDHAWNAVKLYGKWYLLDVTWATSYFDKKKNKIIKDYDELYYLTPPNIFIKNHFPENKKWQLLDKPIRKSEFIKSHIYYSGFFENTITDLQPHKGVINIKLKDTLEIKFSANHEIKEATIDLGNEKLVYFPVINIKDNYYFIKQKFERKGQYELILFLNNKSVAVYKLIIK